MTGSAPEVAVPRVRPGIRRGVATWLHARPRVQLGLLLATPLGWLAIAYLG